MVRERRRRQLNLCRRQGVVVNQQGADIRVGALAPAVPAQHRGFKPGLPQRGGLQHRAVPIKGGDTRAGVGGERVRLPRVGPGGLPRVHPSDPAVRVKPLGWGWGWGGKTRAARRSVGGVAQRKQRRKAHTTIAELATKNQRVHTPSCDALRAHLTRPTHLPDPAHCHTNPSATQHLHWRTNPTAHAGSPPPPAP